MPKIPKDFKVDEVHITRPIGNGTSKILGAASGVAMGGVTFLTLDNFSDAAIGKFEAQCAQTTGVPAECSSYEAAYIGANAVASTGVGLAVALIAGSICSRLMGHTRTDVYRQVDRLKDMRKP